MTGSIVTRFALSTHRAGLKGAGPGFTFSVPTRTCHMRLAFWKALLLSLKGAKNVAQHLSQSHFKTCFILLVIDILQNNWLQERPGPDRPC